MRGLGGVGQGILARGVPSRTGLPVLLQEASHTEGQTWAASDEACRLRGVWLTAVRLSVTSLMRIPSRKG